jgi:lipopolysaccharide transport system permease protein
MNDYKPAELVIEAGRAEKRYWQDLWRYRELFYFLAWRDILVRYKQTVVGIIWALIRPLLTMVVFTVVFGKLAKLPSEGAPYPFWSLQPCCLGNFLPIHFQNQANSLIANANLISKFIFPFNCTYQCCNCQLRGFSRFWHDFTSVDGLVQLRS